MFDGLSGMDWLFIVAALALGFGVVKFMLVAKPGQKAAVPSVPLDGGSAPMHQAPQEAHGVKNTQPGGTASGSPDGEVARPAWFELLDIPRTASAEAIEQAYAQRWFEFGADGAGRLMADLSFIANGGLAQAMPKQMELQSLKAAVTAQQLKSVMATLLREMEEARDEGLMRRRQGLMD